MLNSQDIKDIIKAELKKDKSKSVKDMCQVCEVNKNILSTMASGSMPTLENIAKIADYLGVSVDYLLGRQIKNSTPDEIRSAIISDGVLTIRDTVVTVGGEHIEKHQTKTIESTRQIRLSERIQWLISNLPEDQLYLTPLSGQAIYKRFSRLLQRNGIEHMSFHDLRHMNASVMLALGVPDKYAMERGGWSSTSVMKSVYQHTFTTERQPI